jgi:hypothetical protein
MILSVVLYHMTPQLSLSSIRHAGTSSPRRRYSAFTRVRRSTSTPLVCLFALLDLFIILLELKQLSSICFRCIIFVLKQSVEFICWSYLLILFKYFTSWYICELTFVEVSLVNDPSRIFLDPCNKKWRLLLSGASIQSQKTTNVLI